MLVSIIRFSRHKFRTQYYYETCHLKNQASVALNLLVSLFVVSLRVVAEHVIIDRQTETDTDKASLINHTYYSKTFL